MRHFSLFIEDQIIGPLTEEEVSAKISAGSLTPETLCAPAGSTEWEPLANHFKFGTGLKVNWSKPVQSEVEAATQEGRIDPETRKKLMVYGLADSVSIDQFTQIQANGAIAAHEVTLRATIRSQRLICISALAAATALSSWISLGDNLCGETVDSVASLIIREEGNAQAGRKQLNYELQQFAVVRDRANTAEFRKPSGGIPAVNIALSRLKINPYGAFTFNGKVDTSPLAGKIAKWGIKIGDEIKVYVVAAPPPGRITALIKDQEVMLDEVLAPALDDSGFQKLFAAAMETYPAVSAFPESAKLLNDGKGVRMSSLKIFITRVEFQAQTADNVPARKRWASDLHAFADRLNLLQRKVYTLTEPAARRARWSEFNAGPGAELAAWVLTSNAKEGKVVADGGIVVDETIRITPSNIDQVIVSVRINGDSVFLRWNSSFLKTAPYLCRELPEQYFLDREVYKVTSKTTTGALRLKAKSHSASHDYFLERNSPQWFFLTTTRAGDQDSVTLLVDEKTYEEYAVGKAIPMGVFSKFQAVPRPVDSSIPDPFYVPEAPQ